MDAGKLVDELIRDEGLRLKPYVDSAGKLTIGVGRNLTDVGIAKAEAYAMLHGDIDRTQIDLDQYVPWWRTLDDTRQRVLCNMAFNMGIHSLLEFRLTLAMVQEGRYEQAADEMLKSAWATQTGPRAHRLSEMMRKGI